MTVVARFSLVLKVSDNPGNLLRASDGSRARYIGAQGEVVIGWEVSRA